MGIRFSLGWAVFGSLLPLLSIAPCDAAKAPHRSAGRSRLTALDPAVTYRQYCSGCHGAKGQGGRGDDLRELSDTPEAIAGVITDGQGKMPPFRRKLTVEQVRRLARYVKGFR
jgi:mono/diheme cytochrome c family protein